MIRVVLWVFIVALVIIGIYFIVAKKSHQLAAVSFLFAVVVFLIQIIPESFDNMGCMSITTETTQNPTTIYTDNTTVQVTRTEETEESKTEETEELSVVETEATSIIESKNNIIISDSNLQGDFGNSSIDKYILRTKYTNSYGLKFYISNVQQSYSVTIVDEKGKVCYEYSINEDEITEEPFLDKNIDYTLLVEADEGYPEYKIEVRYPDSDVY